MGKKTTGDTEGEGNHSQAPNQSSSQSQSQETKKSQSMYQRVVNTGLKLLENYSRPLGAVSTFIKNISFGPQIPAFQDKKEKQTVQVKTDEDAVDKPTKRSKRTLRNKAKNDRGLARTEPQRLRSHGRRTKHTQKKKWAFIIGAAMALSSVYSAAAYKTDFLDFRSCQQGELTLIDKIPHSDAGSFVVRMYRNNFGNGFENGSCDPSFFDELSTCAFVQREFQGSDCDGYHYDEGKILWKVTNSAVVCATVKTHNQTEGKIIQLAIELQGNDAYNRCDFETDLCDWMQLAEDDSDWMTVQASATTSLAFDHTLDSNAGSFMVMNQYQQALRGAKAQLGSYIIAPVNSGCIMRFYFYSNGEDGTLNLYTRTLVGGPLEFKWSMSGDQGLMWNRGALPLSSDLTFQVILEAVKGTDNNAFLAVDDISFTPECTISSIPLPVSTTSAPTTTPTTTAKATTLKPTTVTQTQALPTPDKQTGAEIYIAVGIICGILIIVAFLVLGYMFASRRKQGKKNEEQTNIPGSMDNPGYDTDLGISTFAMTDIDTEMFGTSGPFSVMQDENNGGISNPTYSSPSHDFPINNDTSHA